MCGWYEKITMKEVSQILHTATDEKDELEI
jgi:hypothetical protein